MRIQIPQWNSFRRTYYQAGKSNFMGRKSAMVALSALMLIGLISFAMPARAGVIINSPSNGSTVSGVVTVRAQVTLAWWSKLWIDGNGGPTAATGLVSFTWNSAGVADGKHVLTVDAYPSGKPANASESITVIVSNHSSGGGGSTARHFSTLSKFSTLPSDATCAAEIPWGAEPVPANAGTNNTKPTSSQLSFYRANGYGANVYAGGWAFARVDGQYTSTTDMIFRWAACKWGIDEDVVRAQATGENWDWVQPTSGGDKRYTYSSCVNGGFTSLWGYQCSNCCYQSWSDFQTKVTTNWQTWPMIHNSTAFAADFHFASMRACMDGDLAGYFANRPSYNGHTYAGDIASGNLNTIMWGCIGYHYSGNWYSGNSSSGAIWYINAIKNFLAQKSWKTRWPFVKWPS